MPVALQKITITRNSNVYNLAMVGLNHKIHNETYMNNMLHMFDMFSHN